MLRNIVVDAKIPLVDGVKMVSTTPAKVMRVDDSMGSIEIGKKADLCLFDDQINICRTIVGGKVKEF
jgi:N-acetylglucosamine-6-phosphate deacetylase